MVNVSIRLTITAIKGSSDVEIVENDAPLARGSTPPNTCHCFIFLFWCTIRAIVQKPRLRKSRLNIRGNISPSFCRCLGATSRGDYATARKTHGNRHKLRRKPGIRNPREKGARRAKEKKKKENRSRCVLPLLCVAHLCVCCAIATIAWEIKIHGYVGTTTLRLSTL